MLEKNKTPMVANIICVILALAATAAVFFFNSFSPHTQANATCSIIRRALECHAVKHTGDYPTTATITGADSSEDVLIKEKCIARYPKNDYVGGRAVRNTPADVFSPGDFSYTRSNEKGYEFRLVVFGRNGHDVPQHNGIACDLSMN